MHIYGAYMLLFSRVSINALKVACQRANYGETVAPTHVFSQSSGKLTFFLFLEVLYSPHIIKE